MPQPILRSRPNVEQVNGPVALEARLGHLFAEQIRLRELLEQTRDILDGRTRSASASASARELFDQTKAELDRVNAEVLRVQDEYCTTPDREDKYCLCLKKLVGSDPREDLKEIEEAKKNPLMFEDLIAELEKIGNE